MTDREARLLLIKAMGEARELRASWVVRVRSFVFRRADGFCPVTRIIDIALDDAETALRLGGAALMQKAAERLGAE